MRRRLLYDKGGKEMIHQQLLRRAVAGRPPALVDFVETVAPHLLGLFSTIPALGGSGHLLPLDPRLPEGLSRFTEQELARFSERNPDQSLTAHILNGLFAGLRLAERLSPEKAPSLDPAHGPPSPDTHAGGGRSPQGWQSHLAYSACGCQL
jgi:hypothetical protein